MAESVRRRRLAGDQDPPVVGRIDDVLNVAGHRLGTSEVESALVSHPGVAEAVAKAMDEAARKHHMWAFPKLKKLPSDYFREHGAASFQDDPIGIELAERHHLVDNFMWANDYPHHEGSWPHSAQSIERQMGELKEENRAKILGLNAARIFKFDVDALLRRRSIPAD